MSNKTQFPESLRVGFDARWYNDSGVGTYVAGLLNAVAAHPEIDLLVYENPGNPVPGLEHLQIRRIPVSSQRYSPAAQWEFRRRAREDSFQVFHSPFYDIPMALGCPLVVTIHDLIPFLFRIYSWPKQQMVKTGYRFAARKADQIIAVSQSTAADLQKILGVKPERITVVHNAAQGCFHPEPEAGEAERLHSQYGIRWPYVLIASASNWHTKNLEGALRSLQSLDRTTGVKFQTVIYGPPDGWLACRDKDQDQWRDLDIIPVGPVGQSSLAALFRHATAFVMPSLYEGFGLPLVEAMACGCPVITSNRASLAEVAAGGAQLFDPLDFNGIRTALTALLRDPAERQCWKEKALARAANFSWAKAASETILAYRRALAPG